MGEFPDEWRGALDPAGQRRGDHGSGQAQLSNYPSLWRLFEGGEAGALNEMRQRLTRTHQDLERAVRQGSSEEAQWAGRASRAYSTALSLIDSLEESQRVRR